MINASEIETTRQQFLTRPCPDWCVRHNRSDAGTPDESLVHMAAQRYVEGVTIDLFQTEFRDGGREQPFLYVDGEEMSADAAVRFAAELLSSIAKASATTR